MAESECISPNPQCALELLTSSAYSILSSPIDLGSHLHKRIFSDLELVVLNADGDRLPNVLGTYALYGPRLQDPAPTHCLPDEAYVGKSSACQLDSDGDFGICSRSKQVYNHSGTHKIQWNVLIRLLHEQGVAKTAIEVRNMHHDLSMVRTRHSTFVSFSVSR